MRGTFLLFLFFIIGITAGANNDSTSNVPKDTFNLAEHFSRGHVSGHFRNFFMNTINEGSLRDYWTNAFGMSLHYESLSFKGFMFEMKGIFTFQTFSSDLNKKETRTDEASKWEIELYDVLDRNNKTDLDRLEELFIHYQWKNSFIRYGRIPINSTPLLNQRDSRMKPFAFEGFHGNLKINKFISGQSIIIHGTSPRSTVEWFGMNEAIGLNTNGVSKTGETADYHEFLNTHFLSAQELKFETENLMFSYWNFYLDRVFNLNWGQIELKNKSWKLGVIGLHQLAHQKQSNLNVNNQYIDPDGSTGVVSSLLERKNKELAVAISNTYILGKGRFLFPKELGREELYTSVSRSRVDGLGKSSISNISFKYNPHAKKELEFDLICSYVNTPGALNYQYNKYGIRDYFHTVFEIDYNFLGKLKGLELDLLYIYKRDTDKNSLTETAAFNRTNFHQINLIMNVNF